MFVDQAEIMVTAGAGGNGCQAFARPPFSRHAHPSGGSGGDGGDVVLVADPQLATLLDFQFRHEFRAQRGRHGSGNTKTGRCGAGRRIRVPVGTVVYDTDTGHQVRDLVRPQEELVIARGGRGGVGNGVARRATPGKPGEQRRLRLELKLIADVGIMGFPNAGKSSLLARLSTARPKVASYPFTTLSPVLGVVSVGERGVFVACDIPGLIEGAHEGRGLGMQFLRHIERTRLLLHVIDMAGVDGRDPVESYERLRAELVAYSAVLGQRRQVVVANKMDLPEARVNLTRFQDARHVLVIAISCATGAGIPELIQTVWEQLSYIEPTTALSKSSPFA
ncbi:MAG: GTPase ObgE [Candidatus Omnitrophica bacterium]|nr:GTPase ObgE [Candidatus Omnitrophota bacterium]